MDAHFCMQINHLNFMFVFSYLSNYKKRLSMLQLWYDKC